MYVMIVASGELNVVMLKVETDGDQGVNLLIVHWMIMMRDCRRETGHLKVAVMTIDFYHMPESPPCRAVEMLHGHLEVSTNKKLINLPNGDHLSEDFKKLSPRQKVPTIVDGSFSLSESRAILAYLVNRYAPSSSLYPVDAEKRAKVDEMLYIDIGTLYAEQGALMRPMLAGCEMVQFTSV